MSDSEGKGEIVTSDLMWMFVKTKSRTSDKWEGVYDTFEPVVHGGKYIVST